MIVVRYFLSFLTDVTLTALSLLHALMLVILTAINTFGKKNHSLTGTIFVFMSLFTLQIRDICTTISLWKKTNAWLPYFHGHYGVPYHWIRDCLFKSLFENQNRKYKGPGCLVLCQGNLLLTGGFPSQGASNAKGVSGDMTSVVCKAFTGKCCGRFCVSLLLIICIHKFWWRVLGWAGTIPPVLQLYLFILYKINLCYR